MKKGVVAFVAGVIIGQKAIEPMFHITYFTLMIITGCIGYIIGHH